MVIVIFSSIIAWAQRVATCLKNMIFCRLAWLILLLPTSILNGVSAVDYSTLRVSDGWLMDMGLTEVPTNIPCTLNGILDLRENSITRIKADSFACLDKIYTLDLGYNKLTYIAPGAFDSMLILTTVRLRGNRDLPELPLHYGPNKLIWNICLFSLSTSRSYHQIHISTKCRSWKHLQ